MSGPAQLGPGKLTRWAPRQWLHLHEWTSPAAIVRAEEYVDAEAACEDIHYAVVELSQIAPSRLTTPIMTRAMIGLHDVHELLHAELIALRRAHCPRPRRSRSVPLSLQPSPYCGGWTKGMGSCRRRTRGFRYCKQHTYQDAP